jgi:hypothetical protein
MDPLVPGQISSPLEIHLSRGAIVRGVVRAGKEVVPKARVRLDRENYSDTAPKRKHNPPELTALTDTEGRFELTIERPGTITLRASGSQRNSLPTDPIRIRLGEDVDGIVISIVDMGAISGTVSRFDGTPGVNLSVSVLNAAETVVVKAGTDVKGAFTAKDLAPGSYRLRVMRELGFMRLGKPEKFLAREHLDEWPCEVQSGKTSEIDLRLKETALLHLKLDLPRILDEKWYVRCTFEDPRTGEPLSLEETFDGGGFERMHEFVDPCPCGMWIETMGKGGLLLLREQTALQRGTNEIELAPGFGQIQGRLLSPISTDEHVRLAWKNGDWSARVELAPDANGDYLIPCAPAGACILSRITRPALTQSIEVRAGEVAKAKDL